MRSGALPEERIVGVETGGCPHTAIREDASINLDAVDGLSRKFPKLDLVIIESGGDNLAATFSPELADLCIYVIDVAGGDKIPRKGGPGITQSDLLVINKTDLAPHVGASLEVMDRDARKHARPAPLRLHLHPQGRRRRRGRRLRGPRRPARRRSSRPSPPLSGRSQLSCFMKLSSRRWRSMALRLVMNSRIAAVSASILSHGPSGQQPRVEGRLIQGIARLIRHERRHVAA